MSEKAHVCYEACLECVRALPEHPMEVTPKEAPTGALDDKVLACVNALRAKLEEQPSSDDAAVAAEINAHLDDFTLARFCIARELKLQDAEHMFRTTMAWRAARRINEARAHNNLLSLSISVHS
jgi:hypothetical protein